ncbi:MAG: haloacid dehalogenase-like hydrolase [Phycisphaerales bacterium]|nr:haloacid dehalogenase-like hydrolase [Phycisphaerales bacterium]
MLILFDIDATLISTTRAGMHAMRDAGQELYGPSFSVDRTEFAGRLDPLIVRDLLRDNEREVTVAASGAMREGYRRHLGRRLSEPGVAFALPGVQELLADLRNRKGVTLGVLTGNYADTGALKLRAAGIDPGQFSVQVWGDESPHDPPCRDHLPPLALRRYEAGCNGDLRGRSAASLTTIIGDTPHDVRCALASECRVLGVATGSYQVAELKNAGAHLAVESLLDTGAITAWLLR